MGYLAYSIDGLSCPTCGASIQIMDVEGNHDEYYLGCAICDYIAVKVDNDHLRNLLIMQRVFYATGQCVQLPMFSVKAQGDFI